MKRKCGVYGCEALTTEYGIHCSLHRSRNRRHGAPDQRGITKAELQPYLAIVRGRIDKNLRLSVWDDLVARWEALREDSRPTRGSAGLKAVRQASVELDKIGADVRATDVMITVFAVYLMREEAPHRFKSDKAFEVQLVRRVRALTNRNATFSTSRTSGRRHKVYSELSPRVSAVLAYWINTTFGGPAVWIARREAQERRERDRARQRLSEGLTEINFG